MKLLCIVDNTLQEILIKGLSGYYFSFSDTWDKARRALLNERFDFVIAEGKYIEHPSDPLMLWGVASQLRYFGVQSVFIDISFQATNTIVKNYPQIKQFSYQGRASELFLQLQTCLPELFANLLEHRQRVDSASANAARYAVQQSSSQGPVSASVAPFSDTSGRRKSRSSFEELQRMPDALVGGSYNAVSNIPLGMRIATPKSTTLSAQGLQMNQHDKVGNMSASSDFSFNLSDFSSSSGLTPISAISDIERALLASSDEAVVLSAKEGAGTAANRSSVSVVSSFADTHSPASFVVSENESYTVKRSAKDILMGSLDFGALMRILQNITQLKLTGILEIKNELRSIHIEFRNGEASSNSPQHLIMNAMTWTVGDYNFNPGAMLSMHSDPLDIKDLISKTLKEVLPLNPLLRALGFELQKYVVLTDRFDEMLHKTIVFPWWMSCDGRTKLTEIMLGGNVTMDVLARDIYLSWVSDEIIFTDAPFSGEVKIIYEAIRARRSTIDRHGGSNFGKHQDSQSSHVFAVKTELKRIISTFEDSDGYTILGLKQGCGIKALSDAYYAWINRYHTDRFVRFKDESLIQLANKLLVMMNKLYSKLSKTERLNTSSLRPLNSSLSNPRPKVFDELSAAPERIGGTRARVSTLPPNEEFLSDDKLRSVTKGLKSLREDADAQRRSELSNRMGGSQRPHIRPPSMVSRQAISAAHSESLDNSSNLRAQGQAQKMSDILAQRQQSNQENAAIHRPSAPATTPVPSAIRSSTENRVAITPEQYFQTGRKKLLLGLNDDALEAFTNAIKGDPENMDYASHHAYAQFLLDPQTKETALHTLKEHIQKTKDNLKLEDSEVGLSRLFSLFYFVGKITLALEDYAQAQEYLKQASKLRPADVDTQRSLRFAAMQLSKADHQSSNKNFFAKLKDRFKDS